MGKKDRILRERKEREELEQKQGVTSTAHLYYFQLMDTIPFPETTDSENIVMFENDEEKEEFKQILLKFKTDLNEDRKNVSYKEGAELWVWYLSLYKALEIGKSGKYNELATQVKNDTISLILTYIKKWNNQTTKFSILRLLTLCSLLIISEYTKISFFLKNDFLTLLLDMSKQNDYYQIFCWKVISFIFQRYGSGKSSHGKKLGNLLSQKSMLDVLTSTLTKLSKKTESKLDLAATTFYIFQTINHAIRGQRTEKDNENLTVTLHSSFDFFYCISDLFTFSTRQTTISMLEFVVFLAKNDKLVDLVFKSSMSKSIETIFLTAKDAKILCTCCIYFSAVCTSPETSKVFCENPDLLSRFISILFTRGESGNLNELSFAAYGAFSAILQGSDDDTISSLEKTGLFELVCRDLQANNIHIKFGASIMLRRILKSVVTNKAEITRWFVDQRILEMLWNNFGLQMNKTGNDYQDEYNSRLEAFMKQSTVAALNSILGSIIQVKDEKSMQRIEDMASKNLQFRELIGGLAQLEKQKNQPKGLSVKTVVILTVILVLTLIALPILYSMRKK